MNYKLADRIQLVSFDNRVFLIDEEMMELEGCSQLQYRALELLKQGCPLEELNSLLQHEDRDQLLEFLDNQNMLRDAWSDEYKGTIVEKQIYYLDDFSSRPDLAQQELSHATVAIIGVGGVGSVALQHLLGAGVKSFILIDSDYVQRDNLNRQFIYQNSDIGRLKVEAAKDYIHHIDMTAEVVTHQRWIDSEDSLSILDSSSINILINAADQPRNLYPIVNQYCLKRKLPWIGAGVGRHSGSWGPLYIPEETLCMACFYKWEEVEMDDLEKEIRHHIEPNIQASFGATNTIISSFMVKDVILYLALRDRVTIPSAGARCNMDFRTLEIIQHAPDKTVTPCRCWKGESECYTTV